MRSDERRRKTLMTRFVSRHFGASSVSVGRVSGDSWPDDSRQFPQPMSRSPRRSLRMALDALDDLIAVCGRYPDARAELVAEIGEPLLAEVLAARSVIAKAVASMKDAFDSTPG
jgi:hypothetical protein